MEFCSYIYKKDKETHKKEEDCNKCIKMVLPYIRGELDNDQTEVFLEHIKNCTSCREELDIYYTVEAGIKQLDEKKGDFNIAGSLHECINRSYYKLRMIKLVKILYYSLNTLVVTSLIIMLFLQFRIWFY